MVDISFVNEIKQELAALPDDASPDRIASTTADLNAYNYLPTMTLEVPDFFNATKADVIGFLDSLASNAREAAREEDLSLVMFHYKLLQRLRNADPEAWDYVTELMDDD